MTFLGWMLFGLVAGAIARALHPGSDRIGLGGTILLGIVGSLLGGGIAYLLHLGDDPYAPGGWILSILGAILVLAAGLLGTNRQRI